MPVPVPVAAHKPHTHYDSHEYDNPLAYAADHESHNYNAAPDYYTRNDMPGSLTQHGDELESWGLKDFYASTESPGVLSAQAQAFSPYAEHNYKALQAQASKLAAVYKDTLGNPVKQKNKVL